MECVWQAYGCFASGGGPPPGTGSVRAAPPAHPRRARCPSRVWGDLAGGASRRLSAASRARRCAQSLAWAQACSPAPAGRSPPPHPRHCSPGFLSKKKGMRASGRASGGGGRLQSEVAMAWREPEPVGRAAQPMRRAGRRRAAAGTTTPRTTTAQETAWIPGSEERERVGDRGAGGVALGVGEAGAADQREVLGALDAFGGDRDALGAGERDDGADQLGGGRVGEVLDEGLVELDAVVRQPGEVGERAVAGAEVVERDADAAGDQRAELARWSRGCRASARSR